MDSLLRMKGHKLPLHDDSGAFALAVYMEEGQRLLRPTAQAVADQMQAEYNRTFWDDLSKWVEAYPRLTKGGFRDRSQNPLWLKYWHDNDPSNTPEGAAIRGPYVRNWLIDHPVIHQVIGFELNLGLFEAAGWLNAIKVFRMKKTMRDSLAATTIFTPNEIRDLIHGKHAVHSIVREAIGTYALVQERALIHAGLVFVARYCPGPGGEKRTWERALNLVQNESTALSRLDMDFTFSDHSDAIDAVKPYTKAFLHPVKSESEAVLQPI